MATGFTVSGLTDYVDQSSKEILAALQFDGVIANDASVHTGVKGSQALQILTVSPYPQDGSTCGMTASGGAEFTQRTIATNSVKWEDGFCLKDLEPKWTQMLLKAGASYDDSDFPKFIVDEVLKVIKRDIAKVDWRGDTSASVEPLKRYPGLLKAITGASGLITISGSTSITANLANIRSVFQNAVLSGVPQAHIGDSNFVFYADPVLFNLYIQKLANDNLFNKSGEGAVGPRQVLIENSNYVLKSDNGLYGTNVVVGMDPTRNAHLGLDGTGDEDKVEMWYERKDEKVYYRIRIRRGWQIAIPSEVSYFISA